MPRGEKDLISPKDLNTNDLNLRLLREKQKKEKYAKKCAKLRKTELSKENIMLKDVLRGVVGVLPRNSILQEKLNTFANNFERFKGFFLSTLKLQFIRDEKTMQNTKPQEVQ